MQSFYSATDGGLLMLGMQVAIAGGVVMCLLTLVNARCQRLIADWAATGGWEVIAARRWLLPSHPFGFAPGLPVFHVSLKSPSGRERQAAIRCGNLLLGIFSADVTVEWHEPTDR